MKVANTIHLKYADDLTLEESINLSEKLVINPTNIRAQPGLYRARTGHKLPCMNSEIYQQLQETEEYARSNKMEINYKKSKLMAFNPSSSQN